MIHKIHAADRKAFVKLAERMDVLLKRIQVYCPEANMYLEDAGNWNLMHGPSHDEKDHARPDRVEECVVVRSSGGGGW